MAEKAKCINVKEISIILDVMKNPDSEFATDDYIDGFSDGISAAIKEIEAFPTTDVAPVRHGRWTITEILCGIGKKRKYYRCSECYKTNVIRSNFCPTCGAKMDGGENNGT